MDTRQVPDYAVFDDFRYSQRIAVVVQWFLIFIWLFQHNYRPDPGELFFFINNGLVLSHAALRAWPSPGPEGSMVNNP